MAGTNGKGSVSHMLAAILQKQWIQNRLVYFTHLKDFRERIKINGEMMDEAFLVDFVEKTKEISREIKPSFFELTFVMALDYFAAQQVDVAIIETGLGGRLDSTNVITPLLSVITNVSFDHMDILGETLEKIAFEKAGIIKQKVPVVVGENSPDTKAVFEKKAKEMKASIFFAEDSLSDRFIGLSAIYLELEIANKKYREKIRLLLDLNGVYQQKNIVTVLAATDVLQKSFFVKKRKNIKCIS